jgi:hypothetical protein
METAKPTKTKKTPILKPAICAPDPNTILLEEEDDNRQFKYVKDKKKFFVLKGINYELINQKYGFILPKNNLKNITYIDDVIIKEPDVSVSFYEDNKKEYSCLVTMVNFENNKLPDKTNIKCFWCRHNFDSIPLGCPIKYSNNVIEKSYISHITKGEYFMRENITKNKLKNIGFDTETCRMKNSAVIDGINISLIRESFYLTDGIFCSFNCILSYIKDNNHNVLYKESYYLLKSLYLSLIGKKMEKIIPAPSWKLLNEYGGPLSIENYRNSFNKVEYNFIFNISNKTVEMYSLSNVFRKI